MIVEVRKLVVDGLFGVLPGKLLTCILIPVEVAEVLIKGYGSGCAIMEFHSGQSASFWDMLYGFGSWGLR